MVKGEAVAISPQSFKWGHVSLKQLPRGVARMTSGWQGLHKRNLTVVIMLPGIPVSPNEKSVSQRNPEKVFRFRVMAIPPLPTEHISTMPCCKCQVQQTTQVQFLSRHFPCLHTHTNIHTQVSNASSKMQQRSSWWYWQCAITCVLYWFTMKTGHSEIGGAIKIRAA